MERLIVPRTNAQIDKSGCISYCMCVMYIGYNKKVRLNMNNMVISDIVALCSCEGYIDSDDTLQCAEMELYRVTLWLYLSEFIRVQHMGIDVEVNRCVCCNNMTNYIQTLCSDCDPETVQYE